MASYKLLVWVVSLLATQLALVKCLDEDLSFDDSSYEDILLRRNVRAVPLKTTNELKPPVKISLIDLIVPKLLNTTLGRFIIEAVSDTPKFVTKVNSFLGKDVLILKGNHLGISFANLTEILKIRAHQFLEKNLKLHGVILGFAGGIVNNIVDDFSYKIKPNIDRANFTVPSKSTTLQESNQVSANSIIRKLLLDLVIIMIKPYQSRINETLFNVTDQLMKLYNPVIPTSYNYIKSIVTCAINQTALKAIELVDYIRVSINQFLAPSSTIRKRSLEISPEDNQKQTRSLIGVLVSPIRFILSIILTPLHYVLKNTMNYIFVTLRPIVGKVILSPIETIVMAIINLIPCLGC